MSPILIVIIVLTILWLGSTAWGLASNKLTNTYYLLYLSRVFFVIDIIAVFLYVIFHVRLLVI